MQPVSNLGDVVRQIENLSLEHPDFEFGVQMPVEQQQYYADVANTMIKLLPDMPDGMVSGGEDMTVAQGYVTAIQNAVNAHDSVGLNALCAELANSFEVSEHTSDCCSEELRAHDPSCAPVYIAFLWWTSLTCVAKIQCIVKHAALVIQRDQIQLGHCDTQGGQFCRCIPIRFSLTAIMILITVITFFIGGPLAGAAGRELMRRLLLRLAPIGTA
tara:strand:+ start:170175 stop:170819 length:645 start_codon:yes stop_codon:yes gene_type:complete